MAIGYEVVYRIVAHMTPWQIEKGFHPSGNCDTFGAMAVAGKLLKLTETQLAAGLGFSGLFAAGLMEATVSGQRSKCVQVGNAAFNGIAAAYYAREGMDGTTSIFEEKPVSSGPGPAGGSGGCVPGTGTGVPYRRHLQ